MILKKATQPNMAANKWLRSLTLVLGLCFVTAGSASAQSVLCPPNIDFEDGVLNYWQCFTGTSSMGGPTVFMSGIAATAPVAGRHDIVTPATTDAYGGFPTVDNGGGAYALKLGNNLTGAEAERVRYYVHVPVGMNDYSFNFRYAVVLEDIGHPSSTQPAFTINAFDSALAVSNPNTPPLSARLPCAQQNYVASDTLIKFGFKNSPLSTAGDTIRYLPWTGGALPLIGQGGKTIIIEVTSYDCSAGGHFGYGYFDVLSCGKYKAAVTYCNLDSGVVRFIGTGITQAYNWYTSNWTPIGTGAYIDAPIPATPDFFYGVLANGVPGCLDTIRTDTVSNYFLDAKPDVTCVRLGNQIPITTTITGGIGPFTTSWNTSPDLSCTNCLNPIATPIDTTHYVVTTSDKNGCFRHDTVYVKQAPNAGPDLAVCPLGERPVQMHVNGPGGVNYHWYEFDPSLPTAQYLSCTDCTKPVAAPADPVHTYLVGYDGCPVLDTIVVYHDTTVTIDAPQNPLLVCRPGYINLLSATTGPSPYMNLACGTYNPVTCLPQDQDTATLGSGLQPASKANNTPFYSEKRYVSYQFIIPKSEMLNSGFYSGTINSLAFRAINTAPLGGGPIDFMTISLGCIPVDSFKLPVTNQSFITGTTQVGTWTGVTSIPNDWNQFDFTTPYSWDTSMNLLVDICVGPMTTINGTGLGNDPIAVTDGTAIQKADDIINVCGGPGANFSQFFQRPVVRFNYCPSPVLPFEFTWRPGTYLNDSNAQNPTAFVPRTTDYNVYTIGRNGCKVKDSLHIEVPVHTLNVWSQDTFACVQQPVFLHASGADAYQWFEYNAGVFSDASGSLSCTNCSDPVGHPPVTTTYAVVFTNNVHYSNPLNSNYEIGCPDTLFTTVNIWPLPNVVSTNNDTTITFGQTVQLFAQGASHYSWTPVGSLSDPNSPAPIAAPTATTQYVVSGMDSNGCVSRDTVMVIVNYNENLLIPTAFTPNGDGRNDEFRIVNASFQRLMEFRVFNRWGQEVFSTTDIKKGWDGKWKGVPQDMGAYQYLIRVAMPDGKVNTYKGDVSIVK